MPVKYYTKFFVLLACFIVYGSCLSATGIKYSPAIRDAQLNAIEPAVGPNPILRVCGGSLPATAGTTDGGPSYARIILPQDWATSSTAGVVSKIGTFQGAVTRTGSPTHFRIYDSTDTIAHIQGSLSLSGSSGVITLNEINLLLGRVLKVNTLTITDQTEFGQVPPSADRLQYSITVQNDKLAQIAPTVGPSATFKIITGAEPNRVTDADPGTVLATLQLPVTWLGTPASGIVQKVGTWTGTAVATGVATHFRICQSNPAICHIQAEITNTAGGGTATIASTTITNGDTVQVSNFVIRSGNQ